MLAGTRCRQGRRRTILMTVSIKTFDARLDRIVVCIRCVKVLSAVWQASSLRVSDNPPPIT